MAVTQIPFEIPPEIQEGLDAGTLIRFGGVVRDQAGRIVKHLKEKPLPTAESDSKLGKEFIIGTLLVTAIAAGITYVVVKKKKKKEVSIPKCVADFNSSFMAYIDSIRQGTVSEEKIDRVMSALDEIGKNQEAGNISIDFSIENAKLLLDMVKSYTISFAEANAFEMPEDTMEQESEITSLKHYLEIQKQVFEKCA